MLPFIRNAIGKLKQRRLRRIYKEGKTLSRFVAKDVRREVVVISAAEIDGGFITAKVKTTNVLYLAGGLVATPSFGPPERISVDQIWHWTGQSWGGLQDGTSLAAKYEQPSDDTK